MRAYLSSDEGRKDYAEWQIQQTEKRMLQLNKKSKLHKNICSVDGNGILLDEVCEMKSLP